MTTPATASPQEADGYVDTDVTEMYAPGFMCPDDWAVMMDALLHAVGVIDAKHCYACYNAEQAARYEEHEDCFEGRCRAQAPVRFECWAAE